MAQMILIEPNSDLHKIYALNLTTYTGGHVVSRNNAEDAIHLLDILPDISLIITPSKIEKDEVALTLFRYQQEHNLQIPMIVMGVPHPTIAKLVVSMELGAPHEKLIQAASKLLGIGPEKLLSQVVPDYTPILMQYFFDIDHTPCDVFIKIVKGHNEVQFVKRLKAQDSFSRADIEKYEAQGLKEFYIPKDYAQYFVTFVTNRLIKKLEDSKLPLSERLMANANSYSIVQDHIVKFGLDKTSIELADASIDSMIVAVRQSPKLAGLLKMLFSSKISYAYQHAHLVTVLGEFILCKQSWYEPKFLDIFTFVAFFSDIHLKSIEQIRINSNDDLNLAVISSQEKKEIEYHAFEASRLIKDHPMYNEYLETLIREHHGSRDGLGFPAVPDADIHPLSKIFIVTDAFVKMLLDPNGPKQKNEIIKILYSQFTGPSMEKIIKILEQKIE